MEFEFWGPIFALAGVIVGSLATLIGTTIQENFRSKRENKTLIAEFAKEHWKQALAVGRAEKRPVAIPPLESFYISAKYLLNKLKDDMSEDEIVTIISRHKTFIDKIHKAFSREVK